MARERIEIAVKRIEAALARVERAANDTQRHQADAQPHQQQTDFAEPDEGLLIRHEALRRSVSASLAELDALIGALEK